MQLVLKRKYFKPTYTIGTLGYVDDDGVYHYICDTLEPPSAHTKASNTLRYIQYQKTQGYKAVPCGTYDVRLTMSKRFGRRMPALQNVKGFRGVLIHEGNYPRDTRGCILPGWNRRQGMVCGSCSALAKVMELMSQAEENKDKVKLTIFEGGKK